MENGKKISEALQSPVDRRGFVKSVGLATAGLAGAAVVGGKLGILDSIPGINRTGLTARAVAAGVITGKTLAQSGFNLNGTGNPGPTTGGSIVGFTGSSGGVEVTKQLKAVMAE